MKYDPGHTGDEIAPDEHALQLTVWDVPSAIGAGERFRASVGVRCPAGCKLDGRELNLFDQEGLRAGTAKLGRDTWPSTEALYFADVEARAPLVAGSHQWEAKIAGWDAGVRHAAGSFSLAVRVVSAPDCEVTVKVVDRESQAPVKGARVVVHPYRAVTDENGIANLKVTRGSYDIWVSGSKYLPACTSREVTADTIINAELDAEQLWDAPDEVPG